MPVQTTKSDLFGKLTAQGLAKQMVETHEAHKNDEIKPKGGGDLPAGIEGGVAQLSYIKFDEYKDGRNKGKLYFLARATCIEPKTFTDKQGNTCITAGSATQIMEALCDTLDQGGEKSRKTFQEHYQWVLQEVRILLEGKGAKVTFGAQDLEKICAHLTQTKPYFKFRTFSLPKQRLEERGGKWWVGKNSYPSERAARDANKYLDSEPLVNHQWLGRLDEYAPVKNPMAGIRDKTGSPGAVSSANGATSHSPAPTAGPADEADKFVDDSDPQAAMAEVMGSEEMVDLTELVARAEAKEKDAQQELVRLAKGAGATDEQVEEAVDWEAVAGLIGASGGENVVEDATEEPEPAPVVEPKKGETAAYKVRDKFGNPVKDAKSGKEKKPVQCEVTAVDRRAQAADLLSLVDRKTVYKKVPWSSLEQ